MQIQVIVILICIKLFDFCRRMRQTSAKGVKDSLEETPQVKTRFGKLKIRLSVSAMEGKPPRFTVTTDFLSEA